MPILMGRGDRPLDRHAIGILMLDTKFTRPPGDIGNASSYDFPVLFKVVKGANHSNIVVRLDNNLLELFIQAARELESMGVRAITTSCGYLSMWQDELVKSVSIPVFTSNLLIAPLVHRMTNRRIGIITSNSRTLTKAHLRAAKIDDSIPVAVGGLEERAEWKRSHLGDSDHAHPEAVEQEVVDIAEGLVKKYPDVGSFVFECHNLAPYAAKIQESLGVPVFDVISFTKFVYSAVVQRRFARLT